MEGAFAGSGRGPTVSVAGAQDLSPKLPRAPWGSRARLALGTAYVGMEPSHRVQPGLTLCPHCSTGTAGGGEHMRN